MQIYFLIEVGKLSKSETFFSGEEYYLLLFLLYFLCSFGQLLYYAFSLFSWWAVQASSHLFTYFVVYIGIWEE